MTAVYRNVSREARIMTDQASYYKHAFGGFADHQMVDHSKEEYVRGEAYTTPLNISVCAMALGPLLLFGLGKYPKFKPTHSGEIFAESEAIPHALPV